MKAIFILLLSCLSAGAIERYASLSMIESVDNDQAIGACGEVSRYQIMPYVWNEYGGVSATNPIESLGVAKKIMSDREDQFKACYGRPPSDREWYVLWNRPALLLLPNPRHITTAEFDRAQRFANLCGRD